MTTAAVSSFNFLPVRDLKPGLKNVNIEFMILEPLGTNRTKDGDHVWIFKIADNTAAINLAVIGDHGQYLKPGDICKVLNGFSAVFKGALTFYVGKSGNLKRTGEFCFLVCEEPNMSICKPLEKLNNDLTTRPAKEPGAKEGFRGDPRSSTQHAPKRPGNYRMPPTTESSSKPTSGSVDVKHEKPADGGASPKAVVRDGLSATVVTALQGLPAVEKRKEEVKKSGFE